MSSGRIVVLDAAAHRRAPWGHDAVLAVVLVTDELDCSVLAPDGYSYFIDVANTVYWNVNPAIGVPQATSAICFNAGVTCSDAEGDGVYEGCSSADNGVLHPVERYTSLLQSLSRTREVTMLTLVGAPPVLEHAADPPYEPTAGGIADAVYRDWIDGEYPAGDILPEQWANGRTAAHKRFEFGALGPGCFGQNDAGEFTIQALPPVRTREVCESLDGVDPDTGEPVVRCCIESICDSDYEPAFRCLSGTVAQALSD